MTEKMNQRLAVERQYETAGNLSTRISIHAKYSTNPQGFNNWVFSHYAFFPGAKILELGCGTGEIWKSNLSQMDGSVRLTLTDFSERMVLAAKEALGDRDFLTYNVVDIENIPYEANSFDRVIANMMLYHVPNLDRGLSEVRRVLAEDGVFYCATYGENGITEYVADLLKECGGSCSANQNFTLQNGAGILNRYFSDVQRLDYEDSLAVTDIEDLLDYMDSLGDMSPAAGIERDIIRKTLNREMEDGVLKIPKEYGIFICRK